MATIFLSYSHADEPLRDQLEKQLTMLKRQGVITTWHDRRIGAGQEIDREISAHVDQDDIILLLVSPDFLASNYCYDIEMTRAMARHDAGDAIVIPVIFRPCDWHHAPFGKLLATPTDGRPITLWPDRDEAFLKVAQDVRAAAQRLSPPPDASVARASFSSGPPVAAVAGPRSSNLRLAKQFSERDRDRFRLETFEYIANFFRNSLEELATRNTGIEGDFRRVDANRFTGAIYRDGEAVARCTVFMGGDAFMANGIAYLHGEASSSNSYNESLSVDADDQTMFLKSMGMSMRGGREEFKLSQEGAAELYWGMLIEPLQRGYR